MTWGPLWVWDPCPRCLAPAGADCRDLRRADRRPLYSGRIHKGRHSRRVDRPEDMPPDAY